MLFETAEFKAYTEFPEYTVKSKRDSSYMGRFTFDTILNREGFTRILTVIARGYLWERNGDTDYARRALCAWCSVPRKDGDTASGTFKSSFPELHDEFPNLVDENGKGFFYRHAHNIKDFVKRNKDILSATAVSNASLINREFDESCRRKAVQYQLPIFSEDTKGAWVLRFDDVIADALVSGPLRDTEPCLSDAAKEEVKQLCPAGVPAEVVLLLIEYYIANKPQDSEYVTLPVSNFDAYFGNTVFSKKYLSKITSPIVEKSPQSYGVSRYLIKREFLEHLLSL